MDPESTLLRGNWRKSANFSLGAICLGPRIIALDSPAIPRDHTTHQFKSSSGLWTYNLRPSYFGDTRNIVSRDFVDQFSALGQPGRLKIFRLLVRAGPQGLCVEDIKQRVPMPGSTLSHHLDTLTRSGLMLAKRSSRFVYYAVDWDQTARLIRFLTEDCCADLHSGLWQARDGQRRREEPGSQSPRSRVASLGKRKGR
jgi:ArsR family transcriptional regulator